MTTYLLNRCQLLMVIAIIFCNYTTLSQVNSSKVEIIKGPSFKEPLFTTNGEIIGSDENGFYTLKEDRDKRNSNADTKIVVEHFNREMTKQNSSEFKFEGGVKARNYEMLLFHKNEFFVFTSIKDPKTKIKALNVQSIDKTTLELKDDLRAVSSIDFSGKNTFDSGDFHNVFSAKKSKSLIWHSLPSERSRSAKYLFQVSDDNFNEIWKKEIEIPFEEDLFIIANIKIDEDGNVHVLGKNYDQKPKLKEKPNYKYVLLSYSSKSESPMISDLAIDDQFITNMKFEIDNDQNIVCGGFYAAKESLSRKGSFFLKLDWKNGAILSNDLSEFTMEFITRYMEERQKERTIKEAGKGKEIEMTTYFVDSLIMKENGGYAIIAEQYFAKEVESNQPGSDGRPDYSRKWQYHYNDIMVINVSSSGSIEWSEKIAKHQRSQEDEGYFSSYVLTVKDDVLSFVFNDHLMNDGYKGEGRVHIFTPQKEALVVRASINGEGNISREELFLTKDIKTHISPKSSNQINSNELVLFGKRAMQHRYVLVKFL